MYLFPNAKGSPISIDYAQRIYNLAKEKAEIQRARHPHTAPLLCYASFGRRGGPVTIKTLLGHSLAPEYPALFADPPAQACLYGESFGPFEIP